MLPATDEQVASSIRRLDPVDRTLLELSVRRGVNDGIIADVLRVDEREVVRRRDRALEVLADYLGLCGEQERKRLPLILLELPDAQWNDRPAAAPPPAERRRRRWPVVAALLALLAAAGAVLLVATGGDHEARPQAQARSLALSPVIPSVHATGSASLSGGRLTMRVKGLPAVEEAYEVWLYDSVTDAVPLARRVGGDFNVSVQLPRGAGRYRYVDVSREPLDGNPNHSGASVLRVSLERLLQPASR
jgi:hypothetical protein